jgi:hypothetical protein
MARLPENPLPASLQRLPDGTVVPAVQTLHLHQDTVTHIHQAPALPSTSAQLGVAALEAAGKAAPGCGWALGGGAVLIVGGSIISALLQSLAIGAVSAAVAAIGVALAARWMQQALADHRAAKKS